MNARTLQIMTVVALGLAGAAWFATRSKNDSSASEVARSGGDFFPDLAKKTGAWAAFDHIEAMVIPPDLKKALAGTPGASAKFRALSTSRQKQFLYFMNDAKKEETRIKRIAYLLKQLS